MSKQDIICPNCSKAFKVDAAGYAELLKQVRNHEFDEEVGRRLQLAEEEKLAAVKLARSEVSGEQVITSRAEHAMRAVRSAYSGSSLTSARCSFSRQVAAWIAYPPSR